MPPHEYVTAELSDNRLVLTSNGISTSEIESNSVDVKYLDYMEEYDLSKKHQERVEKYNLSCMPIQSIDEVIVLENDALERKYKSLKASGWVSKKQLLNLSGGDEELVDCVYKVIESILLEEG